MLTTRSADGTTIAFERSGDGPPLIAGMRGTPAWSAMESVAHTLVYDSVLANATTAGLLAGVTAPTLVLDSEGSTDDLTGWAAGVAAKLPGGTHRSLAGEWHGVPDETLAPVLADFFGGGITRPE